MPLAAKIITSPRFSNAQEALTYAYICVAMRGRSASLNTILRLIPGNNPVYLHPLNDFQIKFRIWTECLNEMDIMADGIMLKNTCIRTIEDKEITPLRATIEAKYRIPTDRTLAALRELDFQNLQKRINKKNPLISNRQFRIDVIRDWAGVPMRNDYEKWARLIGTSDKTVYRWAGSQVTVHKSIKYFLNIWEKEATEIIECKLREIGEIY